MEAKRIVEKWFEVWTNGDFKNIPVTDDFVHVSPYGSIEGKEFYLSVVEENRSKFLDQTFEIQDAFYGEEKACTRYVARGEDFEMEVTEWYYFKESLIQRIVAYYNIEGEISERRKLKNLNN